MRPRDCPTEDQLRRFSVGTLDEIKTQCLAEHLLSCPGCEMRLAALDSSSSDPLVLALRDSKNALAAGAPANSLTGTAIPAEGPSSSVVLNGSVASIGEKLAGGDCHVGRFELLDELGVGSFGRVFKARDTTLCRTVALKIERAGSRTPEAHDRFVREARSIAELRFSGIVSLHEAGQMDDGTGYLVTEFIDGMTLEARIAEGPLTWDDAARLAARIADALDYAHGEGVIHRDLKPSNILLDKQQVPHLADFGLARRETGDSTLTMGGDGHARLHVARTGTRRIASSGCQK